MLFLKADIKGPLIQSDRGINTIPNLIDPSQNHSIMLCHRVWHRAQREKRGGNNLFLSLRNERAGTQRNTIIKYLTQAHGYSREAVLFL